MKQIEILKTSRKYIISSVVAVALLSGCSDTKEEAKTSLVQESTRTASAPVVTQETPAIVDDKVEEIIETSKEVVVQLSEEAKETMDEVVEKGVDVVSQTVETTKEKVDEVIAPTTETSTSLDAVKLYAKCVACHGTNGEKVALGKSKIIKDMSKEDFIAAMKGYQDGTYGAAMKGIMASQVKGLSEDEIKAIANYIVK